MIKDEIDFAIEQLKILTSGSLRDKEQLSRIIFDVLGYPLVSEALIHQSANKLGDNDRITAQRLMQIRVQNKEREQLKVCKCCGILQHQANLNYCMSFTDLNIGNGVQLYFNSLSYHAIIFTLGVFIYCVYALISSIRYINNEFNLIFCGFNGNCKIAEIGLGPKVTYDNESSRQLVLIQIILALIFIVIWMIVSIYRIHKEKVNEVQKDNNKSSISDFTLLIEDYPKILLTKIHDINLKEFNKIFANYQSTTKSQYSYQVVNVNIGTPLYNIKNYQKDRKQLLDKEMQNRLEVFRSWIEHRRNSKVFNVSETNRQAVYEEYVKFFTEKYDRKEVHQVQLQQKCTVFVTMRSSKARQEINRLNSSFSVFNLCSKQLTFPILGVTISHAPQPDEIKWQNIGFSKKSKICRKIIIYFLAFILIAISLGITIGLGFAQTKQKQVYLSIIISLVITCINFIIEYLIQSISFLENEYNKTTEQASIALKIAVSQLFNCIGIPIAVTYITNKTIFSSSGLSADIFYLGLFNIATPIGRFIDPYNIYLKLRQSYYSKPDKRLKLPGQAKLNQYYASYEMDLGYQYSYIIRTVIFTAFFMPLQPIIGLFAPIGLGLMYAINKYKLFYRFHRPKFHSYYVNDTINWFLGLGPISFALGHLYFISWTSQSIVSSNIIRILLWVTLGLACFSFIFVFQIFYRCFEEPKFPELDYFQKKPLLLSDYNLHNPVTKDKAISMMEEYFSSIQASKGVNRNWQIMKLSLLRPLQDQQRFSKFKDSRIRLKEPQKFESIRPNTSSNFFQAGEQKYINNLNYYERYK